MCNSVKCLGEIQQHNVCLPAAVDRATPVADGLDQLCLRRQTLSKAVLLIKDDFVYAEVLCQMREYNMFHNFATDASQANRHVVLWG